MDRFEECTTCIQHIRHLNKLSTNCGTCSKTEGMNWEANPTAMVIKLNKEIEELILKRNNYKIQSELISKFTEGIYEN